MRIVSGIYKGRVLSEFKGKDIRPTSDMARESLFNILQNRICGATFLDLFCGTGAVGIEALSRGAEKVFFNDNSRESIKLLKTNLEKIKATDNYSITNLDALTFLSGEKKFDIIFMDAPYKSDVSDKVLSVAQNFLEKNGIVICENELPMKDIYSGLTEYDIRKYGRAVFSFYKRKDE